MKMEYRQNLTSLFLHFNIDWKSNAFIKLYFE